MTKRRIMSHSVLMHREGWEQRQEGRVWQNQPDPGLGDRAVNWGTKDKEAFALFSTGNFRRKLLCSMNLLWPQNNSEGRMAWSGSVLDPYMVWTLNRDLLGLTEYEAEHPWGLQPWSCWEEEELAGRHTKPWQLKKTRPQVHELHKQMLAECPGVELGQTYPEDSSMCTPKNKH